MRRLILAFALVWSALVVPAAALSPAAQVAVLNGIAPQTQVAISGMTPRPSWDRTRLYDRAIRVQVACGAWQRMDAVLDLAAHTSQAARRDLTGHGYNASEVNGPSFQVDRGYTGDGFSSYLDPAYNPATAPGALLTQNSAHLGVYGLTNGGSARAMGGSSTLYARAGSNTNGSAAVNGVAQVASGSGPVTPRHIIGVRRDSATELLFDSGAQINSQAEASVAVTSSSWQLLAQISSYSAGQYALFHWGGSLTDTQVACVTAAWRGYLLAVKAITN